MNQKLLCGLLVSFLGLAAHSQDIIRLQDGKAVSGKVIEHIAGDHLRLQLADGSIVEYPGDQVHKVVLDHRSKAFELRTKGYFFQFSINFLVGNTFASALGSSFYIVNGHQFDKRWMVGFGTGFESMVFERFMPLFVDVRYNLGKGKASPYIQAHGGYAVSLGDAYYDGGAGDWWNKPYATNYGGFGVGMQFGYRNYLGRHFGYTLSTGWRIQANRAKYPNLYVDGVQVGAVHYENMGFLKFQMGFGLLLR